MLVRGIRGAVTVDSNKKEEIIERTKELLIALQRENNFKIEDIVNVFFSATPDLNAAFPAQAARELGWNRVAKMYSNINPDKLPKKSNRNKALLFKRSKNTKRRFV
jgi:chorismate mutase